MAEVDDKVHAWLDAGAMMVWVINPRWQSVTVYPATTNIKTLTAADELSGRRRYPWLPLPGRGDFARLGPGETYRKGGAGQTRCRNGDSNPKDVEKAMPLVFADYDVPTISECSASVTAVVGLLSLWFAWRTICAGTSIRTTKLIAETYSVFVESREDVGILHRGSRGTFRSEWWKDDWLLNKSLTLFDTASYLQSQDSLPATAKAWEYLASEIQYFASNDSVCSYIEKRIEDGKTKFRDHEDAIPFTGFPLLLANIPERFHAWDYPCIPKGHPISRVSSIRS